MADLFSRITAAKLQLERLQGFGSSKMAKQQSIAIEQLERTQEAVKSVLHPGQGIETGTQHAKTSHRTQFDQEREDLRMKFEGKIAKEERKKIDVGMEYLSIQLRLRKLGQQLRLSKSFDEIQDHQHRMQHLKRDLARIEVELPRTMAKADSNIRHLRDQCREEISTVDATETRSAGKFLKSSLKIAKSVLSRKIGYVL